MLRIQQVGLGEKQRFGYAVIGALLGATIILSRAWSVFYPYLMDMFGRTDTATFAFGSSCMGFGMMVVAPIICGSLLDKHGPKLTYSISFVCFVCYIICFRIMCSMTDWEQAKYLWYLGSFLVGLGVGQYSTTNPSLVTKWNPDRIGKAFGIADMGSALAVMWIPSFVTFLIPRVGVSNTLTTLGIIACCSVLVLGIILCRLPEPDWKPAGWAPPKQLETADQKGTGGLTLKEAARKKEFWCLIACIFFACIGGFMFSMNLTPIVIEGCSVKGGLDQDYVVSTLVPLIMAVAGVCDAVGRPLWGFIMDKFKNRWTFLLFVYGCRVIAFVVFLLLYTTATGTIIGTALGFICYGGISVAHSSAGVALFGTRKGGAITGATLIAVGIAWVAGPSLSAMVADAVGYTPAFIVAIALILVAGVISMVLAKSTKKAS